VLGATGDTSVDRTRVSPPAISSTVATAAISAIVSTAVITTEASRMIIR